MADHQRPLLLRDWRLKPQQLNGWIANLFMVGSALFTLGCILYFGNIKNEFVLDLVFFTGSIFFTSAAYCQLHQATVLVDVAETWQQLIHRELNYQPHHIAFLSAFSQFIGTLMFNMNTFDAFFDLDWFAQDLLVWTPNILGSILFQISGCLAVYELCNRWWCWPEFQQHHDIHWWIIFINFMGCVAFMISALLAFSLPESVSDMMVTWSTIFTLFGACCFFMGAFLMWPEMRLQKT